MDDNLELVERLAALQGPYVCRPIHNGDCDDVVAGQAHARVVARALIPIIEEREISARAAGAADMHARVKAELHKCGDPCTRCHDAIAALGTKP